MKAKYLSLACGAIALGIGALLLPNGLLAGGFPKSSGDLPGVSVQTSQIESLYGGVPTNFRQCIVGTACIGSRPDFLVCVSGCTGYPPCTVNGGTTCAPCSGVQDSTCSGPITGVSCTQYTTTCCTAVCCCRQVVGPCWCFTFAQCTPTAIGIHQYC
jgi:hypothetical protein